MTESLRLGQVAGVRVGINWSVFVIFALIAFGLAAGRFPALYPDLATGVYAAAGLVAAVLFFLSLLAHELSHAIVARRNGLEVEGITLWLFGGVARLGGEAPDPGADLRIAGVGPLVSLILGVGFAVLAFASDVVGVPGIVRGIVGWLGLINVILAVFNLVPAAPLDGGRILRAFLWSRRGDRTSASITAARAGRVFGFVLIALGIAQFVFVPAAGGLWLVLIGWFLTAAAGAEEQYTRVRGALGDVRVADVMSTDPTTASGELTVEQFLEDYVFRTPFSAFPLVENGGRPVGLVTLNRIKQVPREARRTTTVRQVACPARDVPTVGPDEALADLLPRLGGCADGRAVVVEDGRVVGIVSHTDVARQLERSELRDARESAHL